MKSADEWVDEMPDRYSADSNWIKQIQLDAMREGMRRAAELIHPKGKPYPNNATYINTVADAKDSILSAAKQLTEKDL